MVVTGDDKVGINQDPGDQCPWSERDASVKPLLVLGLPIAIVVLKRLQYFWKKCIWIKSSRCAGVTYLWNDTQTGIKRPENLQYGFIAQELMEVFPKITMDNLGYYQTAYGDWPHFVEAIKELKLEVDTLKEKMILWKTHWKIQEPWRHAFSALEGWRKFCLLKQLTPRRTIT